MIVLMAYINLLNLSGNGAFDDKKSIFFVCLILMRHISLKKYIYKKKRNNKTKQKSKKKKKHKKQKNKKKKKKKKTIK